MPFQNKSQYIKLVELNYNNLSVFVYDFDYFFLERFSHENRLSKKTTVPYLNFSF